MCLKTKNKLISIMLGNLILVYSSKDPFLKIIFALKYDFINTILKIKK